jgi:crotonobetainyl-CoA:carnitine CoA-transferase CaiB-like acyl-CoA transferase
MSAPDTLKGLRVLEFTHAILGPACGLILADLGADVIKIEPPEGDSTRRLKGFGSGYFTMYNRNKRSMAIDLKSAQGLDIVRDLIRSADVLIENFAPGTMDRLGLGYEATSALNPRLIYASLKGFMSGPYEHRTALDEVVQMMSGLAYMTGPPGQPLRAGASIIDIMAGTFGAMGVLVALRERDQSGRGSFVQNGLYETAAYIMGQHMAYSAISQQVLPPMPARVSAWAIYHVFACADGQVFVGVTSDKHWLRFCEVFARPDLASDPSLATNNQRIEQRERLHADLRAMLATLPSVEVLARCEKAEIPFAPIAHPEDLFDDPQLNQGIGLLETNLPDGTSTRLPRLPMTWDGEALPLHEQPPQIGQHTAEILAALGLDVQAITVLHEKGIITEPETFTSSSKENS